MSPLNVLEWLVQIKQVFTALKRVRLACRFCPGYFQVLQDIEPSWSFRPSSVAY